MVFKVQIAIDDLPKAIRKNFSSEIVQQELKRGVAESLAGLRSDLVVSSPVGATEGLRNSWVTDGPNVKGEKISGRVTNSLTQALVVDQGARRHFPPLGDDPALASWIRAKLGVRDPEDIRSIAFSISRKFSRRGIVARFIFTKVFKRQESRITTIMQRSIDRAVKRLDKS